MRPRTQLRAGHILTTMQVRPSLSESLAHCLSAASLVVNDPHRTQLSFPSVSMRKLTLARSFMSRANSFAWSLDLRPRSGRCSVLPGSPGSPCGPGCHRRCSRSRPLRSRRAPAVLQGLRPPRCPVEKRCRSRSSGWGPGTGRNGCPGRRTAGWRRVSRPRDRKSSATFFTVEDCFRAAPRRFFLLAFSLISAYMLSGASIPMMANAFAMTCRVALTRTSLAAVSAGSSDITRFLL